jgi:hypothetical protein
MANGGSSSSGSGGNGGAIRLVAPVIDGSGGTLSARGGQPSGADGAVRFESNDNRFEGTVNSGHVFHGKPLGLFLPPTPSPSIRIESINGVLLTTEEFIINQASSMTVVVEGRNIPTGTVIDLECSSENGQGQTVKTSPLTGTAEHSRTTALVSFPKGLARCFATAEWTPPPLR